MDLFDNDYINLKAKKQAAEHLISCYADFGWSLTERKDDKIYGDTVHMTFTRPHIIENKDELQLLQVRLDIAFNNTGKFARKPKSGLALRVTLITLIAALFIGLGLFFVIMDPLTIFWGGWLFWGAGAAVAISGSILTKRSYKIDKKKYALLVELEIKRIGDICKKAKALRGEHE